MKKFTQEQLVSICLVACLPVFFLIDINTVLGTAAWAPYILLMSVAMYAKNTRFTYFLAAASTALIISGYFLSPEPLREGVAAHINRTIGIVAIWVVAFVCNQITKSKAELEKQQLNVNKLNERLSREAWIEKGYSDLSDVARNASSADEICQAAITYLAEYSQARVGAFYLYEGSSALCLKGRYALAADRGKSKISLNDGYVGQAAAQRKLIKLTGLPSDYFQVNSGTGQVSVAQVILVPIMFEGNLKGVFELGSLEPFSEPSEALMQLVANQLAGAIVLAEHQTKTVDLLEETQRQAEELQAQQEELRVTNEELMEQTKALELAQSEMEKQHAALEESNAEMEQQQLNLEESKKNLELLNKDLISSQKVLSEQARELEAASQYKSEFLANMSHELRTPLNSILLLSQILADNRLGSLSDEYIDFAKTIYSSGNDLLSLINDILDLSKIEVGKVDLEVAEVDLPEFLSGLATTFRLSAQEKGLDFHLNIADAVSITTDQRRLEQILKNFLSNAVKFTHSGGIELTLRQVTEGEASQKAVAIDLKDSGIGIPLDKQQLIFEAFHQADGTTEREYGGTGLGLSIAKELASLLEAEIALESKPGEGSTFTLYLPKNLKLDKEPCKKSELANQQRLKIVEAAQENSSGPSGEDLAAQTIEDPQPEISFRGIQDDRALLGGDDQIIQIIEDDPNFAKLLAQQARPRGFRCILGFSGEQRMEDALRYLPRGIILDLKLPGISGMGVLEFLKKEPKTRHIPVHIISGSEQGRSALYMGAVGFLRKPVSPEDLKQAFDRIEEQHARSVKKVLVVEDDDVQLKSMKAFIEEGGPIEVVGVKNGKKALEHF